MLPQLWCNQQQCYQKATETQRDVGDTGKWVVVVESHEAAKGVCPLLFARRPFFWHSIMPLQEYIFFPFTKVTSTIIPL